MKELLGLKIIPELIHSRLQKRDFIKDIVGYYNRKMRSIFDNKVFLTKQEFKQLELNVKNETEIYYKTKYDFGNSITNENFYLKVEQKLKEFRIQCKKQNNENCERVLKETEKGLENSIEDYKNRMNEILDIINTIDDLNKKHIIVREKVIKNFVTNSLHKDMNFLEEYINRFDKISNKILDEMKIDLNNKKEKLHNKYKNAVNEAKEHYIECMFRFDSY